MTPPERARFVEDFQGFKVYEDEECPPDYVYADDVTIIVHAWNDDTRKLSASLIKSKQSIVVATEAIYG